MLQLRILAAEAGIGLLRALLRAVAALQQVAVARIVLRGEVERRLGRRDVGVRLVDDGLLQRQLGVEIADAGLGVRHVGLRLCHCGVEIVVVRARTAGRDRLIVPGQHRRDVAGTFGATVV